MAAYVALKAVDTLIWLNVTSPAVGFAPWEYYAYKPFGTTLLFAEIVVFGLLPAVLLVQGRWLLPGAALPTLSFDPFLSYTPSWQEVASFGGVVAYGVILYSLSYRYLPLFPQSKEQTHVSGR